MAFRRRRNEWDDFLKRHGEELRACGLPDHVIADRLRFFVFLDHGFDEWDRVKNPYGCFHARFLTDEQIARLARFVGSHVDARYRVSVGSRWRQFPADPPGPEKPV
jgi:hypothetical protein